MERRSQDRSWPSGRVRDRVSILQAGTGEGKMRAQSRHTEPDLTGFAEAALMDGESRRYRGGKDMSADYEVEALRLLNDHGGELRVVRHWCDGIMVLDPVKLIVYDS